MPKKYINLKKGLKRRKSKDFPCGIGENVSRIKSAKKLHVKRKYNDKTIQCTTSQTNMKVGYTWFACNRFKVERHSENKHKVHTNTVHASGKKIIPKESPKRPIKCNKCTEFNSTFYVRHKLRKHTREKREGNECGDCVNGC